MTKKEFLRPDEQALQRVFSSHKGTLVEIILRLAWMAGFSVIDMLSLTWENISFETGKITFEEREIPLDDALFQALEIRYKELFCQKNEHIMISDQTKQVLHRGVVSRLARTALNTEELKDITVTDLRDDFIIRQLRDHDVEYVAKICGIKRTTLFLAYPDHIKKEEKKVRRGTAIKQVEDVEDYEYKLWVLTQAENILTEGLTVWLVWQYGMSLDEVIGLTWEQIDLTNRVINLKGRKENLDTVLERKLRQLAEERREGDPSYVILTPRSRKQFRLERLSRVVGEILLEYGLGDVDIQKLRHMKENQRRKRLILEYTTDYYYITANEAATLLQTSLKSARAHLKKMQQDGELTLVGTRYYLAGTAVPSEKHSEEITKYIEGKGSAQRKEIATVLKIEERQCSRILTNLVREGVLGREGYKYYLLGETTGDS